MNAKMDVSQRNNILELIDENNFEEFLSEGMDYLDSLELKLVNLEVEPNNQSLIDGVYYDIHTIKGIAGFIGNNIINSFEDELEELIGFCRIYKTPITKEMIDIFIDSISIIREVLKNKSSEEHNDEIFVYIEKIAKIKEEVEIDPNKLTISGEKLGEILIKAGGIDENLINEILVKQNDKYPELKFGEVAIIEKKIDASKIIEGLRIQKNGKKNTLPVKKEVIDKNIEIIQDSLLLLKDIKDKGIIKFGNNDITIKELEEAIQEIEVVKNNITELKKVSFKELIGAFSKYVNDICQLKGIEIVVSSLGEKVKANQDVLYMLTSPIIQLAEVFTDVKKDSDFQMNIETSEELMLIEISIHEEKNEINLEFTSNTREYEAIEKDKKYIAISKYTKEIGHELNLTKLNEKSSRISLIVNSSEKRR